MRLEWFKPRRYRHFDRPVNEAFSQKITRPDFVSRHSFSPLLHYTKIERHYKRCAETGVRRIAEKTRPIRYSSHRDSCILSYYAYLLNNALQRHYDSTRISDNVIAYRPLGKSNYDFSAEALSFAKMNSPVTILAFDVTGFFDNLDHDLLKRRFRSILGVSELSDDWYKVFRFITRFHYVKVDELKALAAFQSRFGERKLKPIASVAELKSAGVTFHRNPELARGNRRGIPQGTPISAAASNIYMIDFDAAAQAYCDEIGALYRRYSDDILIICEPCHADKVETNVMRLIMNERLEIASHKTEKPLMHMAPVRSTCCR